MKRVEDVPHLTDDDTSVLESRVTSVSAHDISELLIQTTVNAMPVRPERVTSIKGPIFQISKVDDQTADVKIIHGFRAHFRSKKMLNPRPECFENYLLQAPDEKTKDRILRRGSMSFSDLTVLSGDFGKIGSSLEPKCPWEIDPVDVKLGRRIAVGGFAEVFIGTFQGSTVAVKRLFDRDSNAIEQFRHEVSLLARLRHPNLILFMGYCRTPELSIIYEFMSKGSLYDILRSNDGQSMDEAYIEIVLVSVARGMNYLHMKSPPILHLDLKSPNILIDNAWRVKITDFGVSRLRSRTLVSGNHGTEGTPHWMAPEAIRGEKVNEATDVFSFGVIIWELLTGRVPWSDLNSIQVIARVGFKNQQLPRPDHPDEVLIDLMESCLDHDSSKRPSFDEILTILDEHYLNKEPMKKLQKLEVGPMDDDEEHKPSTPIGTIEEMPENHSFRLSTTTDDTITRSVDRLEIFEQALKSQTQFSDKSVQPTISPFGEMASTPLEDSRSETSSHKEQGLSMEDLPTEGQSSNEGFQPQTNFFQVQGGDDRQEWRIKVAENTPSEELRAQGDGPIAPLIDGNHCDTSGVSQGPKTSDSDEIVDWNLNEEGNGTQPAEELIEPSSTTPRRYRIIPPMSFICRGRLPQD